MANWPEPWGLENLGRFIAGNVCADPINCAVADRTDRGTWASGFFRADKEPRMAASVRSILLTLGLVTALAGCRKDGDMDASLPRPNFDGPVIAQRTLRPQA